MRSDLRGKTAKQRTTETDSWRCLLSEKKPEKIEENRTNRKQNKIENNRKQKIIENRTKQTIEQNRKQEKRNWGQNKIEKSTILIVVCSPVKT